MPTFSPIAQAWPHGRKASVTAEVNRRLLRSTALLEGACVPFGYQPSAQEERLAAAEALREANSALALVRSARRPQLEPRAYLRRGHCLRALGCWRAAYSSYIRAATVPKPRGGAGDADIGALTRQCLDRLQDEQCVQATPLQRVVSVRIGEPESLGGNRTVLRDVHGNIVAIRSWTPTLRSVRGIRIGNCQDGNA